MAKRRKRISRPKPARTAPIRDFSTILGEKPKRTRDAPQPGATQGGDRSFSDAIAEGARLGYSVIEEQIRLGRRVAQNHTRAQAGASKIGDAEHLIQRLMRFSTDFGAMLVDLMGMIERAPQLRAAHSAPPPRSRKDSANGSAAHISIDIEAPGRSKVDLDLGGNSSTADLTVPALYSLDGHAPLTEISFEERTLLVKIPNDQPGGTYTGVVVDRATNRPRGTLSLQLSRPDAAPQ